MQMQLSLRLLYNYDTDEGYRVRYKNLMKRVAEATEPYIFAAFEKLKEYPNPTVVTPWREVPDEFREMTRVSHGYEVNMHNVYLTTGVDYHTLLRNASEGLIAQNLCPDFKIKREQEEAFEKVASLIDFSKTFNYFPVLFCGAYWALRQNKQ
jgi:hypothetical protein